ncbi:MAG: AAA family ATPase, partial [Candidatus Cloacimonetes bacterium]|nr:AAA family ATPase [Candidatus Cloacimonadota bacterium]
NETKASVERLKKFVEMIKSIDNKLQDTEVTALKDSLEKAKHAEKCAIDFSKNRFGDCLNGTGETEWQQLWNAARQFSEIKAYPEQEFPFVDKAKCVFCQQVLEEDAQNRLKNFLNFVQDDSQEKARKSRNILKNLLDTYTKLKPIKEEHEKVKTDLQYISKESQQIIEQFLKTSRQRLEEIQEICKSEIWKPTLTRLCTSPIELLNEYIETLIERANTEVSANDPSERKILELEKNELTDRLLLEKTMASVENQIKRFKSIAKLKECIKSTSAFITTKNGDITKEVVTDTYCNCFDKELKKLNLSTIDVKLQKISESKGNTIFGLKLKKNENEKIHKIASDGEQRCIALAAFLAELSQANHKSTLIFDDPVSSLGHFYRNTIAKRLVNEGKLRQVIIFTHDAVFLNDLKTYSDQLSINTEYRFLEWNNGAPGYVQDGLPWDFKNPRERLDKLAKRCKEIESVWNAIPSEDNKKAIANVYSQLRATLERVIEKDVFSGVISRFRTYINSSLLSEVVGFSLYECNELLRLFQICHDTTEAHDPAQTMQSPSRNPDELKEDIDCTLALLNIIRERKKQNRK